MCIENQGSKGYRARMCSNNLAPFHHRRYSEYFTTNFQIDTQFDDFIQMFRIHESQETVFDQISQKTVGSRCSDVVIIND